MELDKTDLKELQERHAELVNRAESIVLKVKRDKRDPTAEEDAELDRILDYDIPAIKYHIERAKNLEADMQNKFNVGGVSQYDASELHQRVTELDGGVGQPRTKPSDLTFRDAHTGQSIKALAPHEQFSKSDPELNVGRCLYSLATGDRDYLSKKEHSAIYDSVGSDDTEGGYLIPPELGGAVVDLARSASVVTRAGAQTVRMNSRQMDLVRVTSDPTSYWRPEGVAVTASEPLFDKVSLRARTLAAVIPVSLEMMEDAANAPTILSNLLQESMAQALDSRAMLGTGAESQPLGVVNTAGIDSQTSVGTPTNYVETSASVQAIMTANFPGETSELSWVAHPRDWATYDGLTDTTNQPLNPTPWAASLMRFSTTALPTTDGGGSNESTMIVGHFPSMIIGMRTNGVRIRVLQSGTVTDSAGVTHNAAANLEVLIVAYLRADVAVIRPTWFSKLTGVTAS